MWKNHVNYWMTNMTMRDTMCNRVEPRSYQNIRMWFCKSIAQWIRRWCEGVTEFDVGKWRRRRTSRHAAPARGTTSSLSGRRHQRRPHLRTPRATGPASRPSSRRRRATGRHTATGDVTARSTSGREMWNHARADDVDVVVCDDVTAAGALTLAPPGYAACIHNQQLIAKYLLHNRTVIYTIGVYVICIHMLCENDETGLY